MSYCPDKGRLYKLDERSQGNPATLLSQVQEGSSSSAQALAGWLPRLLTTAMA